MILGINGLGGIAAVVHQFLAFVHEFGSLLNKRPPPILYICTIALQVTLDMMSTNAAGLFYRLKKSPSHFVA